MKTRIANRFISVAIMALVLCAVLAVSSFAAVALGIQDDGKLVLDPTKTYTAQQYDIIAGALTGTAESVDGQTDMFSKTSGIYKITEVENSENFVYVFVKNTNNGKINIGTDSVVSNQVDTFELGKWNRNKSSDDGNQWQLTTGAAALSSNGTTLSFGFSGRGDAYVPFAEVKYGFAADQIVPANTVESLGITLDNSAVYGSDAKNVTVKFYTKGVGDTENTVYTATVSHNTGKLNITIPEGMKNDDGYLVGIGVMPWGEAVELATNNTRVASTLTLDGGLGFDLSGIYSEPVKVHTITITPAELGLGVDSAPYQLVATIKAENENETPTDSRIVWSSDDETVVTVDQTGLVTVVGGGNANVIVTAENGTGVSAVCPVSVQPIPDVDNDNGTPYTQWTQPELYLTLANTIAGLEEGHTYEAAPYNEATGKLTAYPVLFTADTKFDADASKLYVRDTSTKQYTIVTLSYSNNALAAPTGITGGFELNGVDFDNKYYQVAELVLNAEGTGLTTGTYKNITSSTALGGLYLVRETNKDKNAFSAPTAPILVYGDSAERTAIGKIASDNNGSDAVYAEIKTKTFKTETYTGGYYMHYAYGSNAPYGMICTSGEQIPAATLSNINNAADETAKAAAIQALVDKQNAIVAKYAFAPVEIIDVKDALSFTVKVKQDNGYVEMKKQTVKFVAYIADNSGNITTKEATSTIDINGKYSTEFAFAFDFTEIFKDVEGYMVGFEIYPNCENTVDNFVSVKTVANIRYILSVNPVNYKIKLPAEAPELEIAPNAAPTAQAIYDITIKDYNSEYTYKYKLGEGEWTVYEGTTGVITVAEPGTYTVQVSSEKLLTGTAESTIVAATSPAVQPTLAITAYEKNAIVVTIENFDTSYAYEYDFGGTKYTYDKSLAGTIKVTADDFGNNNSVSLNVYADGLAYSNVARASIVVTKLTTPVPTLEQVIVSPTEYQINITNYSNQNNALATYEYSTDGESWSEITDGSFIVTDATSYTVRASGDIFKTVTTADITVTKVDAVKPVVSVKTEASGFTITIENYSPLYVYEYKPESAEDNAWIKVAGSSFRISDENAGVYVLRAGGAVYTDWAVSNTFETVVIPTALKNVQVDGTNLVNLDNNTNYEYRKYANGFAGDYTQITEGATTFDLVDCGLYEVRINNGETASNSKVVYVKGATAEFSIRDNSNLVTSGWTSNYGIEHSSNYKAATTDAIADITDVAFSFNFADKNIIPLSILKSLQLKTGLSTGTINATTLKTKVVAVVVTEAGAIEEREVLVDVSTATHTVTAADFIDTNGYLVGIKVYPYGVVSDDVATTGDLKANFTLMAYSVNTPKMAQPTYLAFYLDEANDERGIEGFKVGETYVIKKINIFGAGTAETWTADAASRVFDKALYSVQVKSSNTSEYADSEPVLILVKGTNEDKVLGNRDPSGYYVKDNSTYNWIQGTWTGLTANTGSWAGVHVLGQTGGFLDQSVQEPFYNALGTGDEQAHRENIVSIVNGGHSKYTEGYTYKYAYEDNEILPTSELITFSFSSRDRMGGSTTLLARAKVDFYVAVADGSVQKYEWKNSDKVSTNSSTTYTINPNTDIEGWPTDGYIVGFAINPWAIDGPEDILEVKNLGGANPFLATLCNLTFTPDSYLVKTDPATPQLRAKDAPSATGYGEIAGLSQYLVYEFMQKFEGEDSFHGEAETPAEWITIPAGSTSIRVKPGEYRIRVKATDACLASNYCEVEVGYNDEPFTTLENEVEKIHLASDFTEVKADYEVDLSVNTWIATLALDNLKLTSPDSTIVFKANNYKFVVTASNIETDSLVHYYDLLVSFDGESRHDTSYETLKEFAGEALVAEFFIESVNELPFAEAELHVLISQEYDGMELELRSYNERIGKLRKEETAVVDAGWLVFTNYEGAYVIMSPEE